MSELLHADEAHRLIKAILDRPFARDVPTEVGIALSEAEKAVRPKRVRHVVAQGAHLTGFVGEL